MGAQRELTLRYEVRRLRETGVRGAERPPLVEEFLGLDRARLAALGYALDGAVPTGDRFTGVVEVVRVTIVGGRRAVVETVDVLDERVAFRVLNGLRLPRAEQMAVSMEQMQAEADAFARCGG